MAAPKGNKYGQGNSNAGTPTKFDPKYTDQLIKFFDIEPYKIEVMEKKTDYFKDGEIKSEFEKTRLLPTKLPTLYRFARKIGVAYSTVWRWAEKGETGETDAEGKTIEPPVEMQAFCNAYKEAKELQKEFLINIGLAGAAPPASFIFTAKNITDMRDKVEMPSGLPVAPVVNNYNLILDPRYREVLASAEGGMKQIILDQIKQKALQNGNQLPSTTEKRLDTHVDLREGN